MQILGNNAKRGFLLQLEYYYCYDHDHHWHYFVALKIGIVDYHAGKPNTLGDPNKAIMK